MSRDCAAALAILIAVVCIGFAIGVAIGSERDPRCLQLEQLSEQYRGVSLTPSQKIFKVKATAWYSFNCRSGRRSAENR